MAKLSDFLGRLVSSISDARVNSDMQSVEIAKEYANDELLKHFAVPRMRIDKVEINIPVAIDKLSEGNQEVYKLIDNKRFSSTAYRIIVQIFERFDLDKLLYNLPSKELENFIAEQTKLLETNILVDDALNEFSKIILEKIISYSDAKSKRLIKANFSELEYNITNELRSTLIKNQSENKVLESLQVIVEADKLREIKPENIIMIKFTLSEQGMEWIKIEDKDGNFSSKLMPE
jgi:hypothetical protein